MRKKSEGARKKVTAEDIAYAFRVPYWIAGFGPKPLWKHRPVWRLRAWWWSTALWKRRNL